MRTRRNIVWKYGREKSKSLTVAQAVELGAPTGPATNFIECLNLWYRCRNLQAWVYYEGHDSLFLANLAKFSGYWNDTPEDIRTLTMFWWRMQGFARCNEPVDG